MVSYAPVSLYTFSATPLVMPSRLVLPNEPQNCKHVMPFPASNLCGRATLSDNSTSAWQHCNQIGALTYAVLHAIDQQVAADRRCSA